MTDADKCKSHKKASKILRKVEKLAKKAASETTTDIDGGSLST